MSELQRKGKFLHVNVMKAYSGSRVIAPLILNLGVIFRFDGQLYASAGLPAEKETQVLI
jgi:hypothetical protein